MTIMLRDQIIIGTALFVPLALLVGVGRSLWMEHQVNVRAADAASLAVASELERRRRAAETPQPLSRSA